MVTVKTNKIMEIVACKLFSIENVPAKEQRRMVNRCAKAVAEYHDNELKELRKENEDYKNSYRLMQNEHFDISEGYRLIRKALEEIKEDVESIETYYHGNQLENLIKIKEIATKALKEAENE